MLVLEPEATPQPTATVDSTATDAPTSGEFVDPPIALAPKAALLAGLQGLGNWAETLDTFTQFAQDLPVVGQSLGETLDIGNILLTRLYDRVNAYFTGDGTPTTDELVVALKNLDATVGNLTVAVDDATVAGGLTGANQFRFDLVFEATRTINAVPINLGANAQALGLGVDELCELTGNAFEARDEVPAGPVRDEPSWLERALDRGLQQVSPAGSPGHRGRCFLAMASQRFFRRACGPAHPCTTHRYAAESSSKTAASHSAQSS